MASSPFAYRESLTELRNAGIHILRPRSIWLETIPFDDPFGEETEQRWVNVAFEVPVALLNNLLWCAFASDFGTIRPSPECIVYLFNIKNGIMGWPYDDRGMDVVGPNHAHLYAKYRHYLLDYDLAAMRATFEP